MVTYRKEETQRPEGWNSGAPPHVGVWFCRSSGCDPKWRWWNGEFWSVWNKKNAKPCEVERDFNRAGIFSVSEISWSFYWPENARVARVNPETGEVTGSGPCPYETSGQSWPFGDVKKKAADAPKLKKKTVGNRKVTRYVVMAQHKLTMYTECDGSFALKKNAEARMEQTLKICEETHRMWIQKIRFRTPEA